ncbi:MAG TPA: TauD/TfdA family dioxygenase [Vicinamibacterales bacterium]|nr:TauD/TfdA family dioxygenase [Vicinamibacterales bacterium]
MTKAMENTQDLADPPPMVPRICALPGSFGAEVSSFDLRRLTTAVRKRLIEALHRHLLLIVRDQSLSLDDQVKFTEVFGSLDERLRPGDRQFRHPDDPRIQIVSNDRRGPALTLATLFWHADQSFRPDPSPVIVLKAVEVTPVGGVTMFADMRAAYDALTPDERASIASLKARHHFGTLLGMASIGTARPGTVHPLVREHSITKRRSLYLNQFSLESVEGLPRKRGAELLRRLYSHALKPEFVYSHTWTPGDVLVWDNMSLMHRAADIPRDTLRVLHRTHTRAPRGARPDGGPIVL